MVVCGYIYTTIKAGWWIDIVLVLNLLADLSYSFTAQLNSFIFSNIAPQHSQHNRGEKCTGTILTPRVTSHVHTYTTWIVQLFGYVKRSIQEQRHFEIKLCTLLVESHSTISEFPQCITNGIRTSSTVTIYFQALMSNTHLWSGGLHWKIILSDNSMQSCQWPSVCHCCAHRPNYGAARIGAFYKLLVWCDQQNNVAAEYIYVPHNNNVSYHCLQE